MNYRKTRLACYRGYITQAIIVNLPPLFFTYFRERFSLSYTLLAGLVAVNFGAQILVDFLSVFFVDKIGYRRSVLGAHLFATIGLCSLSILPFVLPPYIGMVIATVLYAVGSGLIEVLISPICDNLPREKEGGMAFLHSFYSWGQMAVVLLSTLLLRWITPSLWFVLPVLWAFLPAYNFHTFRKAPIIEPDVKTDIREISRLFSMPLFWLALVMMICSGASEQAMSQWASTFAENGLSLSKTWGDILGPCLFALFMALGRMFFGIAGDRINMHRALLLSGVFTSLCYVLAVFASLPLLSLVGCALTGFGVSLMWPGMLDLTSGRVHGGTGMFGILAIGGDMGCTIGPWITGKISDIAIASGKWAELGLDSDSFGLKCGLLAATIFPLLMIIGMPSLKRNLQNRIIHILKIKETNSMATGISSSDREILRKLAQQKRNRAENEENQRILALWKKQAAGKRDTPPVRLLFSNFPGEVVTNRMTCVSPEARAIEYRLLDSMVGRELFGDDTPLSPTYDVPLVAWVDTFGTGTRITHAKNSIGFSIEPITDDLEADLDLFMKGSYYIDEAATDRQVNLANEIFGDILPARRTMNGLTGPMTNPLVQLIGLENLYMAMYDTPEAFHAVMERACSLHESFYDELEKKKLLLPTNDFSILPQESFSFTEELPREKVTSTNQMWGFLESQEMTAASPDMYGEFVYPYMNRLVSRYGLLSYGCCERVDNLFEEYLSKWKNLRKLSVSPFNEERKVGEYLRGSNIVYYSKPRAEYVTNPGPLDEEATLAYFKGVCESASGCLFEIAQREVGTIFGDWNRGRRYVELAKEAVSRWWKP